MNNTLDSIASPQILPPTRSLGRNAKAWLMWGVAASFVIFQFFLQLSSGEIVSRLMHSFAITAFGAGILASTYYYIYVTLQIPAGMLIDRFGTRQLLTLGALVCALGCFLFGVAPNLILAALGRLLMGGGAAFAFVGALNIISKWFPAHRFAMMVAFAETVGTLGTVVGNFFLANVVQHFGWRESMIGAGVVGLFISLLIASIVRDAPRSQVVTHSLPPGTLKRDLKFLIKNPVAWVNGIYSGIMFTILSVFVALWAIPFVQVAYHVSLVISTLLCNLVFAGVVIGGPIIGWLDGYVKDRRILLAFFTLASAVLLSVLIYVPGLSLGVLIVLMLLIGVFACTYIVTFAVANEIVPAHIRGTSIGFTNALSMCTAPLLQPLIGLILDLVVHRHATHMSHYTVHDYQIALSILPILILAATVLCRWMPIRKSAV